MPFDSPSNEPKVDSLSNKTKNQSPSLPFTKQQNSKQQRSNLAIKHNKKKNQSVFK